MNSRLLARLVLIVATAALLTVGVIIVRGNPTGAFVGRNLAAPIGAWLGMVFVLLRHPTEPNWWLAWAGFVIPACGLSCYLHLAFVYDWSNIASQSVTPELLFRFLPVYVIFAGGIGAAIGWIVGRNVIASRERYDR
ncbi:MAG: hypothetical protein AAFO81_12805 [Pseudomonadota bacterium]